MKKKLLSVLLCAAMVATMAAGCGSKEEPASTPAPETKEETTEPAADAEEEKNR